MVERSVASEVLEEKPAVGVPLEGGGVALVQATVMFETLALLTVPAPLDTAQFSPLGWVATETLYAVPLLAELATLKLPFALTV
jgi:hypothetical protein